MKCRKGVLRILLFAVASFALALLAVAFVVDHVIKTDVREEMAQTLDALRKDVRLNYEFYTDYRGETNLSFGAFTQTEFGSRMMAVCCDNWPSIIDGYLVCYRCKDEVVVSSSSPLEQDGERIGDVIKGVGAIRDLPDGTYFQALVGGEKSDCLMATDKGYRYVSIVPLSVLSQYRNLPLLAIGLVLVGLVTAFTILALRFSAVSARLQKYIDGEKTRLRDDLESARLVQMSALPPLFPPQAAYSVRARMDPAKVVGGDFYDYQPLPNGNFFFLIADVAGKGISAAMFMMRAKSVAKQCLAETHDLSEGLTKANALLAANNDSKLFVTAWVGLLNSRTGNVRYINAGHNPPVVRRADGSIEWVKCPPSLVLGLLPGVTYPMHELTLAPGDRLFLYTDGVTEAQDVRGNFFGEKRLERLLKGADSDAVELVRKGLDAFQGEAEPSDDATMLELSYSGTPPGAARGFPCSRDVGFVEAVRFVEEELARVACPPPDRKKFLLAFDEVGSNIVNYSGAPYFTVKVAVEATPAAITLTLTDGGKPFNPLDKASPDLTLSAEGRVSGGFGIFITRQLMDDVIYSRDEGRNVLTLRKLGA